MKSIYVFNDPQMVADNAAKLFIKNAQAAIRSRKRFSVALSGGNTPRLLYEKLATSSLASSLDWKLVHLFWGDDRCVPPDDPESNYTMVSDTLLNHVPIPVENIHRIHGEPSPVQAANRYDTELRAFFGETPSFDLVLLGLGEDGHTASLFPGSPALSETKRWAVEVEHTTPPPPLVWRVTLSLPVLNAAQQVVFLVSGVGKARILSQVLKGGTFLPAELIQPAIGELVWLVDKQASLYLERESIWENTVGDG